MQQCLHCLEPACTSACPTTALYRQSDGPVSYDVDKCIGCRYCILACPWDVPTAEWNTRAPKISKCTHCVDRADQPVPIAFNGKQLSDDEDCNVLSFLRRGHHEIIAVIGNFTPVVRNPHRIGLPEGGYWRKLLNSDAASFGGGTQWNPGGVLAETHPHMASRSL